MRRDIKRRIEHVESVTVQQGRTVAINDQIEQMWPEIERYAAELDITPEAFADEVRQGLAREAEIGPEAYAREFAAEMGFPVEDANDPEAMRRHIEAFDREWDEWQERRAAEDAQRVTWRGGVKYIGNVPMEGEGAA